MALSVSFVHAAFPKLRKYRFGFLALMLFGTFIMVLVDHSIAFMGEGGEFVSASTDGLIPDSALLGALMAAPLVAVWAASVRFGTKKQG